MYSNLIADVASIYWKKSYPKRIPKDWEKCQIHLSCQAAAMLTVLLT